MNESILPDRPDIRYRWVLMSKFLAIMILLVFPIIFPFLLFALLFTTNLDGTNVFLVVYLIFIIIGVLLFYLIAKYVYSIKYEFTAGEIIVNKGIITRSHKIVPYRNITNIEIRRNPVDRLLKLGSILIQTAGANNPRNNIEERLDGIRYNQIKLVQKHILDKNISFSGTAATTHDIDLYSTDMALNQMLQAMQKMGTVLDKMKEVK